MSEDEKVLEEGVVEAVAEADVRVEGGEAPVEAPAEEAVAEEGAEVSA